MDVMVLIDSFKGSMTSMEAGNAARDGVLRVYPHANVTVRPLADGGEGTTDALIEGLGGRKVELSVTGPMGSRVKAYYGILADEKTAVMEMAQAAGITLVEEAQRNPGKATTYGVGEMIRDAVSRGCRKFIIGIGGSATNDGGTGMLRALGVKFLTKDGEEAGEGADALGKIHFVSLEHLMPELKECDFQIACDVTNPLCGEKGATCIYGKQKGIREEEMPRIDADMKHYAAITAERIGVDYAAREGAGAAGGTGGCFGQGAVSAAGVQAHRPLPGALLPGDGGGIPRAPGHPDGVGALLRPGKRRVNAREQLQRPPFFPRRGIDDKHMPHGFSLLSPPVT